MEKVNRVGFSGVLGERYEKHSGGKSYALAPKISTVGLWANFHSWKTAFSMGQKQLKETLKIVEHAETGCFVEVDISYPDQFEEWTKNFVFSVESENQPWVLWLNTSSPSCRKTINHRLNWNVIGTIMKTM